MRLVLDGILDDIQIQYGQAKMIRYYQLDTINENIVENQNKTTKQNE